MKPSSQTPTETKTVEQLAIELLTTGRSMTHGEKDARRLLGELRKVWLHAEANELRGGNTNWTDDTASMVVDEVAEWLEGRAGTDGLPDGFRRDVVVAVQCSVCEYEYDEDESATFYFDSVKRATDAVKDAGWTSLADGRVICGSDDEEHRNAGGAS